MSLKKLDIGGPYLGFFPQQMARTNFEFLHDTDEHLATWPDCRSTTATRSTG